MKNQRLILNTKTMLATVALTGLMAGAAVRAQASTSGNSSSPAQFGVSKGLLADDSSPGKHGCKGKNTCKGKGGCATNGTA
jgi:hypothetical protein